MMDMASVSDSDRLRYQDMLEQMVRAVMNPENKKVAFLTFKVAEETIKRVCLKAQVEKLMPVSRGSIKAVKKALAEPSLDLSFTGGSVEILQSQNLDLGMMKDDSVDAGDMLIQAQTPMQVAEDHEEQTGREPTPPAEQPLKVEAVIEANDMDPVRPEVVIKDTETTILHIANRVVEQQ